MNARGMLLGCLATLLGGAPPMAIAHEDAVLKSPQTAVPAGGSMNLAGSAFEESGKYRLRLLGALNDYDLREVEADSAGTFSIALSVPAEVASGSYQIVAIASDGDIVARLDVTVLEAVTGAGRAAHPAADEEATDEGSPGARHDDIRIERSRSGLEWGAIGLLVGLAAGLGLGMIRRGGGAT